MPWNKRTKASQWVVTTLEPAGGWPCFTLTVSDIPPGSNDRLHYMVRHKVYTAYSELMAWYVRHWINGGGKPFSMARITITLVRAGGRPFDEDGAVSRVKPLVDGLVQGGLIPDDSKDYCEIVFPIGQRMGKRRCSVIHVEEMGT